VTQGRCLEPVHGDALTVHLDHRDPLPVGPLEVGDAGDVDLVDLEAELGRERAELVACPLAQVAVASGIQRDGRAQG
jgi:hypothetical protein